MIDHSRQILACARVASDYVVSARENLRILATDAKPYTHMRQFNPERLFEAHKIPTLKGPEYGLLHAGNIAGRAAPLSLELEAQIHGNIVAVELFAPMLAAGTAPAGLAADFADRMEAIAISATVLAEAFRHAAAVVSSEDTCLVVMRRLNMETPREAAPGSDAILDQAIEGHKRRLRSALSGLLAVMPDSRTAADRVRSVGASPYPIWLGYKDHPGSQVINHVWMPKQYAEPLAAHLARMQAQAEQERGAAVG